MGRRILIIIGIVLTAAIWCLPESAIAQPSGPSREWQTPAPIMQDGGSCVGAAWWGVMESAPSPYPVDYMQVYREAQRVDPWDGEDYEGTSVEAGGDVLQSMGILGSVTYTNSIDAAIEWVLYRGPIVWGMAYPMAGVSPQGYLQSDDDILGLHAMEVYGIVDGDTFLIQQSWGTQWGPKRNGHFRAKRVVVEWLMAAYGGLFALPSKSVGAVIGGGAFRELKKPL